MNIENFKEKDKTLNCTGRIQITDPGYDDDVWCRIETEAARGVWHCYTRVVSDEYDERVHQSMVCREGCLHVVENGMPEGIVGRIGVDSGLAGFFFSPKPNYDDKTWLKMVKEWKEIDECRGNDGYFFDDGFVTSTGLGDGMYSVRAFKENGEVVALVIDFWEDLEE